MEGNFLFSRTQTAILTAEVMDHHTIWIPGKGTVSNFFLTHPAGLLFSNNTLHLLVKDPLLLDPQELSLQQALKDLVKAFPLSFLLQYTLQKHTDLPDLSVSWE